MRILFIGDIVGRPGRNIIKERLSQVKREQRIDFTVANAENAAGGKGITREVFRELYTCGIDVFTMGNHVWDNKGIFDFINEEERLIRPLNYPDICPGRGWHIFEAGTGQAVAVINASGRIFLPPLDCPFRAVDQALEQIKDSADYILVDFHAEATSEKLALAYYLDGRVSAVLGTHTHIQTADERILPGGTAYITDIGMTGPSISILGMDKDTVVNKFLTGMPARFVVAGGAAHMDAVILETEEKNFGVISIKRLNIT